MKEFFDAAAAEVLARVSLKPLRGKTVLLTGVNGLIGSHLAATLAYANHKEDLGCRLIAMSRSTPPSWVQGILETPGFTFRQVDLAGGVGKKPEHKIDYVIHAATYGQPKKFLENPLDTMRLNAFVTHDLLEWSRESSATFLFLSSSEIYGSPPSEVQPAREDYCGNVSPLDQRSAYTSSKRFGETLCKVYQESRGVRARIARVCSAYGPGVRLEDDRVLNVFVRRALETGEIKMLDHGQQRRRWLYISDAVAMLFFILLHSRELVYNVAGSDFRSVAELATCISKATGTRVLLPPTDQLAAHTTGAPSVIDIDNRRICLEAEMNDLIPLSRGILSCVSWTKRLLAAA